MDVTLQWNEAFASADWAIVTGAIEVGSDLQTAVIVSLFTDARAPPTYLPGANDPRGTWIDDYSPTDWGSLLWTLGRAAQSGANNLLLQAKDYSKRALQWMLDDGVAASVDVQTAWLTTSAISITITITEPNVQPPAVFQYSWAWNQ
jgi:phage gp46-like protein